MMNEVLPSQRCHGHKHPKLTFHAVHPPQQSQMSDSKLDSGCRVQPEKEEWLKNEEVSKPLNINHLLRQLIFCYKDEYGSIGDL